MWQGWESSGKGPVGVDGDDENSFSPGLGLIPGVWSGEEQQPSCTGELLFPVQVVLG